MLCELCVRTSYFFTGSKAGRTFFTASASRRTPIFFEATATQRTIRRIGWMTNWIRFVFIVFVIALDDFLHELVASFTASSDFLRYRVMWIVQDKLRSVARGGQRSGPKDR